MPVTGFIQSAETAYTANGVNFNGTNTYLSEGDLVAPTASKLYLGSVWFKLAGGDSANRIIFAGTGALPAARFLTNNTIEVKAANAGGTTILSMVSTTTYTSAMGAWAHLLFASDQGTGRAQMRVDDADVRASSPTVTDDTITFAAVDHAVGGNVAGGALFNGDMADLMVWLGASRDLDTEANRRLFIDAGGKPVDPAVAIAELGDPVLAFYGDTATWHTNQGTGGGFTENGALTTSSTGPSD